MAVKKVVKKTVAKKPRKKTVTKKVAVTAKSRATGKAPTKRLKARRAANKKPGYYPNPVKKKPAETNYVVEVVTTKGQTGYLTDWTTHGPKFDTLVSKAKKMGAAQAKLMRNAVFTQRPRGLRSVDVKRAHAPKK